MEFLIAILMYLGMVSPDMTASCSAADMQALVSGNQQTINWVLSDPGQVQQINDVIIDRRED